MEPEFPNTFDPHQLQILEMALIHARQALTEHEDGCTAVHDFVGEVRQIDEALAVLGYDAPPRRVPPSLRKVRR
jgi:hypothetical protein